MAARTPWTYFGRPSASVPSTVKPIFERPAVAVHATDRIDGLLGNRHVDLVLGDGRTQQEILPEARTAQVGGPAVAFDAEMQRAREHSLASILEPVENGPARRAVELRRIEARLW